MNDSIIEFGFNADLTHEDYIAWESIGTKYNFNLTAKLFGLFLSNNKYFLLSEVTQSFGDNCMKGTVDVREVAFDKEDVLSNILIANNVPSEECMMISRMLSTKETRAELDTGTPIEQTKTFQTLAKLGLDLKRQDISLGERVTVCGIEPVKFDSYKSKIADRTR